MTELVAASPPLDRNSPYCNLLQCSHFADTSIVAEQCGKEGAEEGSRLLGWISGYRPPTEPDALFIWQVAVHSDARGAGLGGRMIAALLDRPGNAGVTHLLTTVTADNDRSWALFGSVARRLKTGLTKSPFFERDRHFAGAHPTEWLARIGPF